MRIVRVALVRLAVFASAILIDKIRGIEIVLSGDPREGKQRISPRIGEGGPHLMGH